MPTFVRKCVQMRVFVYTRMCVRLLGDTTAVQLWKFIKRSWATFLNAHGIRFGVDSRTGGRIFDEDADDDDADRADRTETINGLSRIITIHTGTPEQPLAAPAYMSFRSTQNPAIQQTNKKTTKQKPTKNTHNLKRRAAH